MFWMMLAFAIGCIAGWVHAHSVVAKECRRLGGFYVNKTVYKCVAQEPRQ